MSTSSGDDHLHRTATKPRHEVVTNAEIQEMKNLSQTVKLLKLDISNKQFAFKAGQWVDMFIPGVDTVGGFSMASPPHILTEFGQIHLAIKYSEHPPAHWIHTQCQEGSKVKLRVGGDFYYDPVPETEPRDLLLLAGGVGVNPLFSMLQHFAICQTRSIRDLSAHMLFSASCEDELIFKDELINLAQATKNVQLNLFCTQAKPAVANISFGRIQESDVHSAISRLDKEKADIFLCGPSPFIEAMKSHCSSAGVSQNSIHYETWWLPE
ncbi:oxidoreductase NAD-binding domain-containing protein 1-like [Plakobranchus ocellatus]|uniref:Oxidoreductase NAD-binding domain-containing protein 1 n=1 Tax=Plakobranchus ocellatus TaxID=259542 RepID=A0AAV4CYK7_9GAST|nr:oxidoreductase NAD-binding domain-containing protein 1-like [Plakobranchus ocellatus]